MMQERLAEKEPTLKKGALNGARSEEDIRETIRTIERYLMRTKETIERVEKFVQDLKQEKLKEADMGKEEDEKKNDPEKSTYALKV